MTTYWVELNIGSDWTAWSSDKRAPDQAILSDSQYKLAKDVQSGDVLLHYVLGVHCWSGYSHVVEPPVRTLDPQTEWEKAYPYNIRIRQGKLLYTPYECSLTHSTMLALSHNNWHRKAYVRVKVADALLVKQAVDEAYGKKGKAEHEFLSKWNKQRDDNASKYCKENSKYRCALCETSAFSWCDARSIKVARLRKDATDLGWFLHAHHIKAVADGGNTDLGNLLCVCPNCHLMTQQLNEAELRALLRQLGIRG
jgi:hypothetical protein